MKIDTPAKENLRQMALTVHLEALAKGKEIDKGFKGVCIKAN